MTEASSDVKDVLVKGWAGIAQANNPAPGSQYALPISMPAKEGEFNEEEKKKIADAISKYWVEMDKAFNDIKKKNESNYYLIVSINLAMVIIGIALVTTSVVYSIQNNRLDFYAAITSGIGVGDLITLLLVNPQARIKKVLSEFVQMGMIYRTWANQMHVAYYRLIKETYNLEAIKMFQDSLTKFTDDAATSINNYIVKG